MKKTLLVLAMMMATGSVYAAGAKSGAAVGDSRSTVGVNAGGALLAGGLSAGSTSGTAAAASDDDANQFIDNGNTGGTLGATRNSSTGGDLNAINVDNGIVTGSYNARMKDSFNDTNSNNSTTIGGDGNIVHANDMDQAVAESDLNGHVMDTNINIAGGSMNGNTVTGLGNPIANVNAKLNYNNTNSISGSYARLSGVSSLQFNAGSATSVQQSIVVASDVGL